jgi:hypothetical protein
MFFSLVVRKKDWRKKRLAQKKLENAKGFICPQLQFMPTTMFNPYTYHINPILLAGQTRLCI